MPMNKKVVIGMSGGVDSSVAAALLIEQGYDVSGVYLECYNEPGCRTDQDKADALKVALKLNIPFKVMDFRKEYREKVVEYFYSEYKEGRTPNPDVVCNREVKFGIFFDWAMTQGYDYVATGHYARIVEYKNQFCLARPRDLTKDQSYFLWQVPNDHLDKILFPLGGMLKSEVRERANQLGLEIANKSESMGICFIGEVNVNDLLKKRLGEDVGDVVMEIDGKFEKVGTHNGLWFYTIGERGGFNLDKMVLKKLGVHPETMKPMYVIGKEVKQNQLIIGERSLTMRSEFQISEHHLIETDGLFVRIRNLGELHEVVGYDGKIVKLAEPIFGVAQGQSAVFYARKKSAGEEILVGGGIIV